jgi:putative aldouronate transport system permease protein
MDRAGGLPERHGRAAGAPAARHRLSPTALRRQVPLHVMMIPAVLVTLVFAYGPLAGIVMAFQRFEPARGFLGSPFVGLDNFVRLFRMNYGPQLIWNTFYISLMKAVANQVFPIVLAILLHEVSRPAVRRVVQTALYLPYFLSWVILGAVLRYFLSPDGFVNVVVLAPLGIEPILFLGDKVLFPYTLVATDLWQNVGFGTIIFLAAITSANPELYEAATMDGANRLRLVRHVTVPAMTPIIVLTATLSLGSIFNAGFDQIYMLQTSAVMETGDVIDTFVYRMGLQNQQYSLAAAVGLFKSTVSLVLVSLCYYTAYRYSDYRIF